MPTDKLVLIGNGPYAQVAYEYFTHDSPYKPVGFSVDRAYIKENTLFGLSVVPFDEIEQHFPPSECFFHAAVPYSQMNGVRTRFYQTLKEKNYLPVSFISPHSRIWHNVEIGEHCFIFEQNVVQPFCKIGNNTIMWSNNNIAHHTTIGNNCFIASEVAIPSGCVIGDNCSIMVNSTFNEGVHVGSNCLIAANALVLADVPDNTKVFGIWKGVR